VADHLSDCRTSGLSSDWRLNIAYNAALQTATATLAASGYRAVRGAHHYRVIHSLAHRIKADVGLVSLLDQFRKKRNISEYDYVGMISDQEAKEMVDFAIQLRKDVEKWLRENHPDLLAGK
jgi:hypothetical protein